MSVKNIFQKPLSGRNSLVRTLADRPGSSVDSIIDDQIQLFDGEAPKYVPQEQFERIKSRIPVDGIASGLDALLCAILGLVPASTRKFMADSHFVLSSEHVSQIEVALNSEVPPIARDSYYAGWWWLIASYICTLHKEEVDRNGFALQIEQMNKMRRREKLQARAINEMRLHFNSIVSNEAGFAFGQEDGAMHAAYVLGYKFAVQEHNGLYFVGTYTREGLGLESFPWSSETEFCNGKEMARSGLIFPGLVKCHDWDEVLAVVKVVKRHLDS